MAAWQFLCSGDVWSCLAARDYACQNEPSRKPPRYWAPSAWSCSWSEFTATAHNITLTLQPTRFISLLQFLSIHWLHPDYPFVHTVRGRYRFSAQVTGWTTEGLRSIIGRSKGFCCAPKRPYRWWGPPCLLLNGYYSGIFFKRVRKRRKPQLNYSVSRPTSKQGPADEKFRIFTYWDRMLERIK